MFVVNPYIMAPSLSSVYKDFSFTNMWSAENTETHTIDKALTVSTDELVVADNVLTPLATTTTGTWSVWVKPTDPTPLTNNVIICFGDTDAQTDFMLYMHTSGTLRMLAREAGSSKFLRETDNPVFVADLWTHVAIVQDGVTPTLYVNGVAVPQSYVTSGQPQYWFNDMTGLDNGRFGCRKYNSAGDDLFFDGSMTDVLLINRVLTAPQIVDIYNNGVPKDESSIANAIAYYRFSNASDNYNSDIANEWRFYDEISSITVDTTNCEVGDVATDDYFAANDYAGEHNLYSVSGEEPTYNASSALTASGLPSLTFNGLSTGVEKHTSDWRGSDSQGMVTWLLKPESTKVTMALVAADNGTTNRYWGGAANFGSNNILRVNTGGAGDNRIRNVANDNTTQFPLYLCTVLSTGTEYKVCINGIFQDVDVNGINNGQWIDDLTINTDNITIGKSIRSSVNYGDMEWFLSGYHSIAQSEADVIAMHQDIMRVYQMDIQLSMSKLNQINPIIHGWTYNWTEEISTTTYGFDLTGEITMNNPAAANQPTLNADHLHFNAAGPEYLSNSYANFRSSDSTGVMHFFVENENALIVFGSADSSQTLEYWDALFQSGSDQLRVIHTLGGGTPSLRSTNDYAGYGVFSIVQDGVQMKFYWDGVEVTDYDITTLTDDWFNDSTTNDIISIGAVLDSSPLYGTGKIKGVFYSAYVDQATAVSEAVAIKNSGL